ncbi:septal ring lytic transglycosylase RlpA family protein [Sphingopyxis terrae]|jgi:rare lipoprotein A|uniref:Endolytic peptidoglycan transglycosylase RlpA n=2 Tax=Sphingopyxis TaxID=165697 RepID=A0A1Y6EZS7_9SPHN|nr:septal ring lytic transglycosylase RlpA family protein [Sphingopyxis terrae]MBD3745503.1 septal ring lytic transglycosylase RlpA family protein [Sphingopyxis terrae]PCF92218.1 septal ring lytic transglycosylase RlpA family protein [Sphingopyxis terrae subsp. ummariensis]SMQ66042.1 rare lipoprotein A [Sphingopyxis terrae subsp. ummariensis]
MRRVMAMSLALMLAMPAVAQDQIGGGETEIGNGTASYYGRELAGNRTASGERFDPDQMTAAHPTLAFGSKVRVTNLSNGQSVIVRVNDRGPFGGRRVIDISQAAAKEIGMHRSGTAKVSLTLVADQD